MIRLIARAVCHFKSSVTRIIEISVETAAVSRECLRVVKYIFVKSSECERHIIGKLILKASFILNGTFRLQAGISVEAACARGIVEIRPPIRELLKVSIVKIEDDTVGDGITNGKSRA